MQNKFTDYYFWKLLIDFISALLFVLIFFPFFVLLYLLSSIDIRGNGIFIQTRIGQYGKPFLIYKFRTINIKDNTISRYGKFLRKYKIDELPQFFNILKGEMSLVGPRPDLPGYYDLLQGADREVLRLKPGITSEASIKYRHEEEILNKMRAPNLFNDSILFPDKLKMNLEYLENFSFKQDLHILLSTVKSYFK